MKTFHFDRIAAMRATAGAADDAIMALVNTYTLTPLTRDQVACFSMEICNNQIDHHFSKFPDEELPGIVELLPGRPLMELHDTYNRLPRGVFFRAGIASMGDLKTVRADVYILRLPSNEEFIRSLEGGVYRETSIGFTFMTPECSVCHRDMRECEHLPGQQYDGATCYYIMRGIQDVIEASIVPAGSQGTKVVSALRSLEDARKAIEGKDKGSKVDGFTLRDWHERMLRLEAAMQ